MNIAKEIKKNIEVGIFDAIYKSITFRDIGISHFPILLKRKRERTLVKQQKAISSAREKDLIKVAFFMQTPAVWKYDNLYWLLEKEKHFAPIVVITPYNVHWAYGKEEYLRAMEESENYCIEKGYNYRTALDKSNNSWLDVRKAINPDVIFFTKPYKDTLQKYHIYNFTDKLTCYTPYGFFFVNDTKASAGLPIYSLLWKFFVETDFQKRLCEKYSVGKGINNVITGCLATEPLINESCIHFDRWKSQTKKKKRIIWAPHHTIDYLFNFSTFLQYANVMLQLADKYNNDVQFVFKPHPVLKAKLIKLWGEEKTDTYYNQWNNLGNAQLEEGYYMDLFYNSDALIHDCDSFRGEYLYMPQKPPLFLVRNHNITDEMNEFGKQTFDQHYHAENLEQIEHFIQDVVINGNDPMRPQREQFFKDYLYPKDGVMPSQKIMNILKEELGK